MKSLQRRIALALLLLPVALRAQTHHTAVQPVHATEGTLTIPTYELGPSDPNPPFSVVNPLPVYPYTMLDNLTDKRIPQTYRTLELENQYLKIIVLPELGGHVYSVYDKVDHREVLYRDHVIKYGLVGPRGAWISGGMEFSFPTAHTTDTVSPVESTLRHNPDGSATAVVGAIDWVSNMHWEIAITLRPDTARVEEGVTLFNSTPANHLYLFWTNTAVSATDDTQYIYPMREIVEDDPYAPVQSWPLWHGQDESWYKNDPTALAIFGRDVQRSFFGVYYHRQNYGVVHVADYRQDPGKKMWTWGTAQSGKIWDKILSDNDGSYNEIQSGRFSTQGYREFLNPRRVEQWTEYWYPVRGLDGGYVEATPQMAINITNPAAPTDLYGIPTPPEEFCRPERTGVPGTRSLRAGVESEGPCGSPAQPGSPGAPLKPSSGLGGKESRLLLTVSPVAEEKQATILVQNGDTELARFRNVHLTPLTPLHFSIPVADPAAARKTLTVTVLSGFGQTLLHWSAAAPLDGNPSLPLSSGKPLESKAVISAKTSVEQLYLEGVFREKQGNDAGARAMYRQALERDPGYTPAILEEAWRHYRNAEFEQASDLLSRIPPRLQQEPAIAYTVGVVERAQGHLALAKDALWNSIHYGASIAPGATLAPSFVELGEIELQQKQYDRAAQMFSRAITYNPQDGFAHTGLALAERLAGNPGAASWHSARAIDLMPLLPYALAEHWQDDAASGSEPGLARESEAAWTKTIQSDPENYLAVAAWYHSVGAFQSSDAVISAAQKNIPAARLSPMFAYYRAANARAEGNAAQAQQSLESAAKQSSAEVFPNRLTDVAVLEQAMQQNPNNAQAKYAYANFLFAHGRYDQAAQLWQQALAAGDTSPVLLRNLGVYEWRIKKNLASAADYYSRAIAASPNEYRLYPDLDSIYEQESTNGEQQGGTAAREKLFANAPPAVLDQDTVRARRALLALEQWQPDAALAILANHRFKPWEGGVIIHNMFVRANIEKGQKALAEHNPAQAIQDFETATQYPEDLGTGAPERPDIEEPLYWLGTAYQAQGNSAEAQKSWTRAAELGHEKAGASAVYAALAEKKLGNDAEANRILDRVLAAASEPDATADSLYAAGLAEQARGHKDRARADFERALDLDPGYWPARLQFHS